MVQGFYFCPAAIQPYTSVYSAFCAIHAVIQPTPQNSAQGFTEAFPAICRIFSLLCGGVSSYTAPPATRWSISQRRSTSSEYQIPAPRRTLYRTAQPPYYNKVYKGAAVCPCYRSMPDGATHRRPCQPGGLSMLPTPGISMAPGWPGISLALCFLLIEVSNSRSLPAGIVVANSRSFSNNRRIVVSHQTTSF